ncbi:hypothetical protein MG296_13445 [Flavobacteriaceae bacterium TK19130]|nr:hypothetical protein [Thermobacterium salinum]
MKTLSFISTVFALASTSFILFGCSTDDSATNDVDQEETVSFEVLIYPEQYDPGTNGIVLISDTNGTIKEQVNYDLSQGTIVNSTFQGSQDEHYTVTVLSALTSPEQNIYLLHSSLDVPPGNYIYGNELQDLTTHSIDVTMLGVLNDDGTPTYPFNYSPIIYSGTYYSDSFIFNTVVEDGAPFYAAFKRDSDAYPRYYWRENVNNDVSEVFEYASLPEATDIITMEWPENTTSNIAAYGYLNGNDTQVSLASKYFDLNEMGHDFYTVHSLFDYFIYSVNFETGNKFYNHVEYSEESTFIAQNPNFDFSLSSFSSGAFQLETTGSFTGFQATSVINNPEDNFYLIHHMYGSAETTINVDEGVLMSAILDAINAPSEPTELELKTVSTFMDTRIDGDGMYSMFTDEAVAPPAIGDTYQSIRLEL